MARQWTGFRQVGQMCGLASSLIGEPLARTAGPPDLRWVIVSAVMLLARDVVEALHEIDVDVIVIGVMLAAVHRFSLVQIGGVSCPDEFDVANEITLADVPACDLHDFL